MNERTATRSGRGRLVGAGLLGLISAAPALPAGAPVGAELRGDVRPEILPAPVRLDGIPRFAAAPDAVQSLRELRWDEALPIAGFAQALPTPGAAPTRRTELRLAHDGRSLYVQIRAFDAQPRRVVARQMRRDAEALWSDDYVALVLDVEGRGRNGFLFLVNPNGTQYDGLIYDGGRERSDWDARWHSEALVEDDGWSAWLAIPLAALGVRGVAGEDSPPDWRLNAERHMARGNERVRLAGLQPGKEIYSLGDALPLPGVRTGADGWGLRFKPSLRLSAMSAAASPNGKSAERLEAGLEVFHRAASGIRSAFALNVDFGEAEADDRVVNLTRFELFRPEKREFFLQDAGRFSFGGLGDGSLVPYYSRRIGLDAQGQARDLEAGLKLSGAAAGIDFGVLAARVAGGALGAGEPDQPRADLGVLRVAKPLAERGRAGLIATLGNPEGTSGSWLWGLDYQYRDTALAGDRTIDGHAWVQQSDNAGLGTAWAYGASVDYPNPGPTGRVSMQRIESGFLPALGFLSEDGVRETEAELGWWHRTERGGGVTPGIDVYLRRTLDGREETTVWNPEVVFENAAGDYIVPEAFFEEDRLAEGYELLPGIDLTPGHHRWSYLYLLAGTSPARPWSAEAEARTGGYYDGRRKEQTLSLTWHPGQRWSALLGVGRNDIALPAGRYIVRTATFRFDLTPNLRLAQSLLLQWDNVSEELGISVRLRWRWATGRELYFALDRLSDTGDRPDAPAARSVAMLKLVWELER